MAKVLIITGNKCDDSELMYPYFRLIEAGYEPVIAAATDTVTAKYYFSLPRDVSFDGLSADGYAGLVLPGGNAPEKIRLVASVKETVREFVESGRPVCSVCHGAQVLISAGVVRGRHATCYPGVTDDLINAGALYEDSRVVVDGNLVTSRRPEDLPYMLKEFIRILNTKAGE